MGSVSEKEVRQIIDSCCEFGCYAVGLAIRYPDTVGHAFDIDPRVKCATGEIAKLNG